jgi:hypothetical protein
MPRLAFPARRPSVLRVAAVLFAASLCIPAGGWALDSYLTRATLKGIQAVEVLVEGPGPGAERDGLGPYQIHAEVASRLTQARISVVPRSPEFLYVVVTAEKDGGDLYAYSIRVELSQPVTLIRNPTLAVVSGTWSVERSGVAPAARLSEVRTKVADLVDLFIQAYREQNPKP